MEQRTTNQGGLSASSLKIIAVVTMLIDHIAAVILGRVMISRDGYADWINVYQMMRNIGRIAFPIYCFMLVEGFLRTRNVLNYLARLFAMALISEIPFNLALGGKAFYPQYQNVMFTLCIGLLGMYAGKIVEERVKNRCLRYLLIGAAWIAAMFLAEGILADYGAKGIFSIGVIYLLRQRKELQLLGGALSFIWELPATLAFAGIAFYNGKKGISMRGFFYAFYPVHLLVLYLISAAMGMGAIGVV